MPETQVDTGLDLEKNQNKIKLLENLPWITIGFETDHKSAASGRHNRTLFLSSSLWPKQNGTTVTASDSYDLSQRTDLPLIFLLFTLTELESLTQWVQLEGPRVVIWSSTAGNKATVQYCRMTALKQTSP